MKAGLIEPMLRDATIKAIDGVAKRLTDGNRKAGKTVDRLLSHWNDMEAVEKEQVAGIVIATATTAATAIVALRRRAKSPVKSAGKALVRSVAKKMRS